MSGRSHHRFAAIARHPRKLKIWKSELLLTPQAMFLTMTVGSLVLATVLFGGIVCFAWQKHLLLIPEGTPS